MKQYMLSREREKKTTIDDGHPDSEFGNKLDAFQKYEISN